MAYPTRPQIFIWQRVKYSGRVADKEFEVNFTQQVTTIFPDNVAALAFDSDEEADQFRQWMCEYGTDLFEKFKEDSAWG